ncbi:hypothetical protein Bbelb_187740 [Branchiostoma belcheri]|nr:hypothetical protein Bbelb_187740 [Branchiostoma belcheri]
MEDEGIHSLTETTLAELYPSMRLLASVLVVIPVSTADSERSFSNPEAGQDNDTLNALLTISIDGPSVNDLDFKSAILTTVPPTPDPFTNPQVAIQVSWVRARAQIKIGGACGFPWPRNYRSLAPNSKTYTKSQTYPSTQTLETAANVIFIFPTKPPRTGYIPTRSYFCALCYCTKDKIGQFRQVTHQGSDDGDYGYYCEQKVTSPILYCQDCSPSSISASPGKSASSADSLHLALRSKDPNQTNNQRGDPKRRYKQLMKGVLYRVLWFVHPFELLVIQERSGVVPIRCPCTEAPPPLLQPLPVNPCRLPSFRLQLLPVRAREQRLIAPERFVFGLNNGSSAGFRCWGEEVLVEPMDQTPPPPRNGCRRTRHSSAARMQANQVAARGSGLPSMTGPHWLEEEEGALRAWCVPPEQQGHLICQHLTGEALEDVKALHSEERDDIKTVLDTLKRAFRDTVPAHIAMGRFYTRRQEDYTLYALDLRRLLRWAHRQDPTCCPNPGKTLRDQFVEGLFDASLKLDFLRRIRQNPNCNFYDVKDEALAVAEATGRTKRAPAQVRGAYCSVPAEGTGQLSASRTGTQVKSVNDTVMIELYVSTLRRGD